MVIDYDVAKNYPDYTRPMLVIEALFCLHPKIALNMVYVKLLYRGRFAHLWGAYSVSEFEWYVLLPEIIGMCAGSFIWTLSFIRNINFYTRSTLDNTLDRIEKDKSLTN